MEPNYVFCLLAFYSLLAELLLKGDGRFSLSDCVVSMLALQLSVGKQINIQRRACCSSTFGYHALCCLSDQSLEFCFLPSICCQHLKYKFIFLFLNVAGLRPYFNFIHAFRRSPRLFLASKLA